jgi:hypothetical protein
MKIFTLGKKEKYSLSQCVLKADDLDFREKFEVTSRGMVVPMKRYIYSPEEASIYHHYLVDNPKDRRGYSLFYLIETAEGRRGFLMEEENDFSDGRAAAFIREIPGNKVTIPASPVSWLRLLANLIVSGSFIENIISLRKKQKRTTPPFSVDKSLLRKK